MTYTHDDVELVARALYDQPGDLPFDYYDDAKRALDALAAAGWRRPDPPRPARCPATVGDGHTARPMHPDGECQPRSANEAARD